jgi:hypothetical protein
MITEINQNRLQLLQSNEPVPSRFFLLCGVTPEILQGEANESGVIEGDQ